MCMFLFCSNWLPVHFGCVHNESGSNGSSLKDRITSLLVGDIFQQVMNTQMLLPHGVRSDLVTAGRACSFSPTRTHTCV